MWLITMLSVWLFCAFFSYSLFSPSLARLFFFLFARLTFPQLIQSQCYKCSVANQMCSMNKFLMSFVCHFHQFNNKKKKCQFVQWSMLSSQLRIVNSSGKTKKKFFSYIENTLLRLHKTKTKQNIEQIIIDHKKITILLKYGWISIEGKFQNDRCGIFVKIEFCIASQFCIDWKINSYCKFIGDKTGVHFVWKFKVINGSMRFSCAGKCADCSMAICNQIDGTTNGIWVETGIGSQKNRTNQKKISRNYRKTRANTGRIGFVEIKTGKLFNWLHSKWNFK